MIKENQDIRKAESTKEIANCLETNIYGEAPLELINFFEEVPVNRLNDFYRTLCVPYLFFKTNEIFNLDSDPTAIEKFGVGENRFVFAK